MSIFRQIAFHLNTDGIITMNHLSRKMNLSEEYLENIMNHMVRLGLMRIEGKKKSTTTCSFCPIKSVCHPKDKKNHLEPTYYTLTDKGISLLPQNGKKRYAH